jgi:hypothetical protein
MRLAHSVAAGLLRFAFGRSYRSEHGRLLREDLLRHFTAMHRNLSRERKRQPYPVTFDRRHAHDPIRVCWITNDDFFPLPPGNDEHGKGPPAQEDRACVRDPTNAKAYRNSSRPAQQKADYFRTNPPRMCPEPPPATLEHHPADNPPRRHAAPPPPKQPLVADPPWRAAQPCHHPSQPLAAQPVPPPQRSAPHDRLPQRAISPQPIRARRPQNRQPLHKPSADHPHWRQRQRGSPCTRAHFRGRRPSSGAPGRRCSMTTAGSSGARRRNCGRDAPPKPRHFRLISPNSRTAPARRARQR